MSEIFLKDTRDNTYTLIPVLIINEGGSPYYFSTHNINLEGVGAVYNILQGVPRIKESLDIDKSTIKNHHLQFNFFNYGYEIEGFNSISEFFGSKELINKRADLFFLTQSAKSLEDGYKIFSGQIKKAKHSKEKFTMDAESLSSVFFKNQVPAEDSRISLNNYPLATKKIVNKYLPLVFGEMDNSPAYHYAEKILTSSPEFSHGSLINKYVIIGSVEYPTTPISIYQGGYWPILSGPLLFTPSDTGLTISFDALYYNPTSFNPGGQYYTDFNEGIQITLTGSQSFRIAINRKPISIDVAGKTGLIEWNIIKNTSQLVDGDYISVESGEDWYNLDLSAGEGSVEVEKVEEYFKSLDGFDKPLESYLADRVLDLYNNSWLEIKGRYFQGNENTYLNGDQWSGKFLTSPNHAQLIFNFTPIDTFIPSEFELSDNSETIITKFSLDGSAAKITTEIDVTSQTGFEYSAGDQLFFVDVDKMNLTLQGNENHTMINESTYFETSGATQSQLIDNFNIKSTGDNSQEIDNAFGSYDTIEHHQAYSPPLHRLNKIAFGFPKQVTGGSSHNGWLGDDGYPNAPPGGTGYGNLRWNVEAKIYGMEMIHEASVSQEKVDVFVGLKGIKTGSELGENLQNFHYSETDIDEDGLGSHPAIINSLLLEHYTNLSYKKYGKNSLKSAVDYSVVNWMASYSDLPYSIRYEINKVISKADFYRSQSDQEFRLDFYIDDPSTLQNTFDSISQHSTSIPYITPSQKNELQFINLSEKYNDSSIAHYKENEEYVKHQDIALRISRSDVINYEFELSNIQNLITELDVYYAYDTAVESYKHFYQMDPKTFLPNYKWQFYGDKKESFKLELRNIKRPEVALRYAAYYLMERCNRHLEVMLDLPTKFMYLQIGDLILFDEILDVNGTKPYDIDYSTDYNAEEDDYTKTNGQVIFKYFMVIEITKSLKGIKVTARQLHDLAPFKDAGVIGCADNVGDIVNGMLCIRQPDNYDEDVNVNVSNSCNHIVGCASETADNYAVDSEGDPVDENGNKITLHDPNLCVWASEEEIEEEEEEGGETEDDNEVEDPDEEAEDDTAEPDYSTYYQFKESFSGFIDIQNGSNALVDFTFSSGFYNPGSGTDYLISNMIKLSLGIKWENTSDGLIIEDSWNTNDSLSNSADGQSFALNPSASNATIYDALDGVQSSWDIGIVKTNGTFIPFRDINNSDLLGFANFLKEDLFRFVAPNTICIGSGGEEQTLDFNGLEQHSAFSFTSLGYSNQELNGYYEALVDEGWINEDGVIKYKLKYRFIPESFVDTLGNSVEAIAMQESDSFNNLTWYYQTDLGPYFTDQTGYLGQGDVNLDNTTNILDIVSIVQYILGNYDYNLIQQLAADINQDGTINILDVVDVLGSIFSDVVENIELNHIWRFTTPYWFQNNTFLYYGAGDLITESYPNVGFLSFQLESSNSKIMFLPSPDGITIVNSSYHNQFQSLLSTGNYSELMETLVPAGELVQANTPVDATWTNQWRDIENFENGDIVHTINNFSFTGSGTDEWLIAIAIIENNDGSAVVSTKKIKIEI